MKQIIAIFAAITFATGLALAGSAATAGTTITLSQHGVTYATSDHSDKYVPRGHHRNLDVRHDRRIGHGFFIKSKRHGISNRSFHKKRKLHHRSSTRRGSFRRY